MKFVSVAVGVLVVIAGVTFGLQGIGVLGGSSMSGSAVWAVLGPLIAVFGVAIVVRALRSPAPRGPGPRA
jgi:hypothetical protein